MEEENVLQRNMCDYTKPLEIIQIILICIGAFIVPTYLAKIINIVFGANSQIIVGSVVNVALIVTAINVKGWKKIVGIITLPSISAILGGYVFKTASIYMCYMIPAIWFGNFMFVYLYKLLLLKKNINYFLTGMASIVVKVGIIFLGFSILNIFRSIPRKIIFKFKKCNGNNSGNHCFNCYSHNLYRIYHE